MGYTKTIELSIDSAEIARQIADTVADYINETIREIFENDGLPMGTINDILCDGDFWNNMIEDLIPQLKA